MFKNNSVQIKITEQRLREYDFSFLQFLLVLEFESELMGSHISVCVFIIIQDIQMSTTCSSFFLI